MIPEIGVMIGLYIFARMLKLFCDPDPSPGEIRAIKIFAALTALAAIGISIDLITRSAEVMKSLPKFP